MSSFINYKKNIQMQMYRRKLLQMQYKKQISNLQKFGQNQSVNTINETNKEKLQKEKEEKLQKEKEEKLKKEKEEKLQKEKEEKLQKCIKNYFKKYRQQNKNIVLFNNYNINLELIDKKTIPLIPELPNLNKISNNTLLLSKRLSDPNLKVYLYFVCYNESFIIPHLLKHYDFVDKIFVYDNCSNDDTVNILNRDPRCEIIRYSSSFNDTINANIKNNCWKQHIGECDYCIVQDADEFLYYPENLHDFLLKSKQKGKIYSYFPVQGINMVDDSEEYSNNSLLYKQINTGYIDKMYSKFNIFSPNLIVTMNYTNGSHTCNPVSYNNMFIVGPKLFLLHFKYIGGIDRLKQRQLDYSKRLSKQNISRNEGLHYLESNSIVNQYKIALAKSTQLI